MIRVNGNASNLGVDVHPWDLPPQRIWRRDQGPQPLTGMLPTDPAGSGMGRRYLTGKMNLMPNQLSGYFGPNFDPHWITSFPGVTLTGKMNLLPNQLSGMLPTDPAGSGMGRRSLTAKYLPTSPPSSGMLRTHELTGNMGIIQTSLSSNQLKPVKFASGTGLAGLKAAINGMRGPAVIEIHTFHPITTDRMSTLQGVLKAHGVQASGAGNVVTFYVPGPGRGYAMAPAMVAAIVAAAAGLAVLGITGWKLSDFVHENAPLLVMLGMLAAAGFVFVKMGGLSGFRRAFSKYG